MTQPPQAKAHTHSALVSQSGLKEEFGFTLNVNFECVVGKYLADN